MCVEFCNDGKCYLDLISKVFFSAACNFRALYSGYVFFVDKQLWNTPICCAEMISLEISFSRLCKSTTTPI